MNSSAEHLPDRPKASLRAQLVLFVGTTLLATAAGVGIQKKEGGHERFFDPDGWGKRGFSLAEGKGLIDDQGNPSAMRGPVVPLVYAAAALCFGKTYGVLLAVQAVSFGMAAGFLSLVCWRIFGRWQVAVLSTLMYIAYLPAWPWVANIFSEPIFTAVLAVFVLLWLGCLENSSSRSRWFVLGVAFAVVALCRPAMYLFLPIVVVHALWRLGRSRNAVLALAWLLFGFAVLEIPWVVRNQIVLGKPVFMTTGSSQVLHAATWYQQPNYLPNERGVDVYHDPERFPPAAEGFWDLSKEEQDRRFRAMALDNWRTEPVKVLLLIPKRVMLFFFQMRPSGWLPTWKSMLLCGCVYSTAILGFLLSTRQQRRDIVPCLLLVFFTAGFYSMIQSEYRYSHPVQPYLLMLSSFGVFRVLTGTLQYLSSRPRNSA